jgi:hypothetical protein
MTVCSFVNMVGDPLGREPEMYSVGLASKMLVGVLEVIT